MTKIHYDEVLLKNNVTTNVKNSIDSLNNTNNICMGMIIPQDFTYTSIVNDFKNTVTNELSDVKKVLDILNNSEMLYNDVNKVVFGKINSLDSYQIKVRESGIKG